jgi:Cu(I)/Ag(I) efflux system membrane fusion protein
MNDTNDKQPAVIKEQGAIGGAPREPREHVKDPLPPRAAPPRGPSGKAILALLAGAGLVLWIGVTWSAPLKAGAGRIASVLGGAGAEAAPAQDSPAATVRYYTCGMHPWVVLPKPGDCPICHMKLTPIDPAKFTGEITINPVVAQNIGVRVAPVTTGPLTRTIRTVGTVDYNETAVRDVNIKLAGWIEKLHVTYMGEAVTKGQPLLELYAPDLYSAQEEYLLALRDSAASAKVPATGPSAEASRTDVARGARDLLSAARTRLEYYDITAGQIAALEQRGQATKTMTLYSPHTGVVIAKNAFEGMHVEPGTQLFRIADLSSVWVMVALYEYQLPYVQVGQEAAMSLSYIPGQQFQGKVIYIYPTLDEKTRQVQVRLEFPNPQGLLKPGMFAQIQLRSTLANDRTLAPRSAIIDTGERKVAFVSLGDGRFEPRNVLTGAQAGDGMIEVLDGLKPGEQVVTSGQFLIDSEANTRDALAKMIVGNLAADQKTPAAPATHPDLAVMPEVANKLLAAILTDYLTIQETLANDSIHGLGKVAGAIGQRVDDLLKITVPDDPHFWHKHEEVATVRGKALELAGATAIDQARLAFADLSVALGKFLGAVGVPASYGKPLEQLHCPMFREGQGGSIWLQPAGGEVRNPYFGQTMPHCFDARKAMPTAKTTVPGTGAGGPQHPRPDDARTAGHAATGVPGVFHAVAAAVVGVAEGQPTRAGPEAQASRPTVRAAGSQASRPSSQPALPKETQLVNEVVQAYLKSYGALNREDLAGAKQPMPSIMRSGNALHDVRPGLAPLLSAIGTMAAQANDSHDLAGFREAFGRLSPPVIELAKAIPPTPAAAPSLYAVYCPMVNKYWLQAGKKIDNPYARSMATCGTLKSGNLVHEAPREQP